MADIVVIGGSIMGSSLAYHMAIAGEARALVVVEPDPTNGRRPRARQAACG